MKKLLFIQQSVLSLVHYYLYYSGRMSSDSFRRCLISVSLFDIKDQSSFGVGFFIQELNHFTAGKILLRDVNYCFFKIFSIHIRRRWIQSFSRLRIKSVTDPFFPLSMKCMTAGTIMLPAFISAFYPKPNKNERNFTPMFALDIPFLSGACP